MAAHTKQKSKPKQLKTNKQQQQQPNNHFISKIVRLEMGNGKPKVAKTQIKNDNNNNNSSSSNSASTSTSATKYCKIALVAFTQSMPIPRSITNSNKAPTSASASATSTKPNNTCYSSSNDSSTINSASKLAVLLANVSRSSPPSLSARNHTPTTPPQNLFRMSALLRRSSKSSNNNITSNTSTTRVFASVAAAAAAATTMASVSFAMAVPIQLVVAVTDVTTAAAAATTITASPSTNQSSTSKDALIGMDLTNETFSIYPALIHYHGDYDVSYIAKINPFWLQFEPPSKRTYYIMAILYTIISGVGCIGNALVIFMFMRCKSLRTPANTLVINLAVSDLIMLVKCPIAVYNNFKQGPALGDLGCRIYGFIGGLSGTASIGTLTAIALDRYNVVVHPLDPLRKSSKLRPQLIITVIWIYSFIFSVAPALNVGLSEYVPEGFLTTCSFDYLSKDMEARTFMFLFFVAAWCIPFGTICFCYFYILKVVFAANRIQSSKNNNKTEQKLAMIVVGIIGLWFLAWTPYSIVAMLGVFGKEQYITPLGSMIPALFCKTAACIDPYIYAATHPRFRMEFRRFLHGKSQMRRSSTIRSSYLTRSSTTRRLRVISDVDMRNRSSENNKNKCLHVVPEITEENDEYDIIAEELRELSSTIAEQSRF